MGRTRVHYIVFLTFIILPVVRSQVTCNWTDSIPSDGVCFLYNATPLSYADAKCSCQSIGGVLAKVTTKTQMVELTKDLNMCTSVWIGANDIDVEGTWMWEAGGVATELYELWFTKYGEPSNRTDENCAGIFRYFATDIGITDNKCSATFPFLCMEKGETTTQNQQVFTCKTTDPATTEPATKDPATTEPKIKDPDTTEPTRNDPATTQPTTHNPATTQPTTHDPAATEPTINAPVITEPTTNAPATTQPTTNAILISTPISKCPSNGTVFSDFNFLLFFLLCVVIFLFI